MHETLVDIAQGVRSGTRRAADVVEETLAAIDATNGRVNAFVLVDATGARRAAADIDRRIAAGEDPGPFAGVPIGVKDMPDECQGLPTRNGSLLTINALPAVADSEHIARLRAAGAIIVGKTATAEFGLDGVTHTIAHGTTRNPWNLERTPSGSSGGSSAAVSARMVPLATGGDGLGSIRCPAGFTGLVGLKPSLGRIPRTNGFADTACPGALTTTVKDTARYLDVVSGPDDRDRMTLPAANVRFEDTIDSLNVEGLRVVWSVDLGFAPVEPEVADACRRAAFKLIEVAGLELVADRFECTNAYVAWNALAAVRLRRLFEADGFLPERLAEMSPGPRRFVERYAYRPDAELAGYERTVMRVEQEMAQLFKTADVLITPTACCVPYAAEGPLPEVIDGRDASATNGEPFTALGSIAWNPSISVPAGVSSDGLPIGVLINVRRHRDDIALRLARISELANPWPRWAPGW